MSLGIEGRRRYHLRRQLGSPATPSPETVLSVISGHFLSDHLVTPSSELSGHTCKSRTKGTRSTPPEGHFHQNM